MYGTGQNGDVFIQMINDELVVVFVHDVPFAWPRLVRDGAFIQVVHFGDDSILRLEFMTKPRRMPDGRCYSLLESGPEVSELPAYRDL